MTAGLVLVVLAVMPAFVFTAVYLDSTLGEATASVITACAVPVAALLLALSRPGRSLRSIRQFVEDDRSDQAATWQALVQIPHWLGLRMITVILPLQLLTTYPLVIALADLTIPTAVVLLFSMGVVALAASLFATAISQLLVHAAASELTPPLGQVVVASNRSWSIRRRFVLTAFVSTLLGVSAGPVLVLGTATSQSDYVVAVLGGAAFAVYFAWAIDTALVQPSVAPVHDLLAGTVRVRHGDLDAPVPVSSLDELGELVGAFNEMQRGLKERAALHAAFGSYVDPALAQRLIESGSALFAGEDIEVSVLFTDVRDFTSYAESVTPTGAVERLNRLFDLVVPVLHDHHGHANHYLGDGLLAVFGAPQTLGRHADAAVAAAIEIQRVVRSEFGSGLRLGIGINTGPVIAGTVGGGGRHEFTVIGDTVNVASRIEQLTKDTGDLILITEATRSAMSTPRPRSIKRGAFEVKGKSASVVVHAVPPFSRQSH